MLCSWAWRKQILGCRSKCLVYVALVVFLLFVVMIQKDPSVKSIINLELPKCPACYGISACTNMVNGQYHLMGWNRWRFLHVLNKKNVYHATIEDSAVVLKKLAHNWELELLDAWLCKQAFGSKECDVGAAAIALSSQNDTRKATAMSSFGVNDFSHCMNHQLLGKVKDAFAKTEPLSNKHANVLTLMHLNPEPLIIQTFPYEEGWPFPKHLGACGRVVVENYVGPSLASYGSAPWRTRATLAYKLTVLAEKLTNNQTPYCLYMTDIMFSNFAISAKDEVILVDVENVVVATCRQNGSRRSNSISRYANRMTSNEEQMVYSIDELCSPKIADHNYYGICQGILSSKPWSNEVDGGLLHSFPSKVNARWNITNIVNECSKPTTHFGRFTAFAQLQKALKAASMADDYDSL